MEKKVLIKESHLTCADDADALVYMTKDVYSMLFLTVQIPYSITYGWLLGDVAEDIKNKNG